MSRGLLAIVLCSLAGLAGGGCGGDDADDTLSVAETGAELSRICDRVSAAGSGLNGDPQNDAPILGRFLAATESAIRQMRNLDVPGDLAAARDRFATFSERQLVVQREAQALAARGDAKAYLDKVGEIETGAAENDRLARALRATRCGGG